MKNRKRYLTKKTFLTSHKNVVESFPIYHSIATFLNRLYTSRIMKMLRLSNLSLSVSDIFHIPVLALLGFKILPPNRGPENSSTRVFQVTFFKRSPIS